MNSNEVEASIENAWVEFERVGEISHSNADNLLTAVTNIKASSDRAADEIAELREMLQRVMKCAAMQDNELIDAEEIKKLLNK